VIVGLVNQSVANGGSVQDQLNDLRRGVEALEDRD